MMYRESWYTNYAQDERISIVHIPNAVLWNVIVYRPKNSYQHVYGGLSFRQINRIKRQLERMGWSVVDTGYTITGNPYKDWTNV